MKVNRKILIIVPKVFLDFFGIDVDTEIDSPTELTRKQSGYGQVKKDEYKPDKEEVKYDTTKSKGVEIKVTDNSDSEKKGKEIFEKKFPKSNSSKRVVPEKNLCFVINMEKNRGKGEDASPILMEFQDNTIIIGVADGMGGAGGTIYDIENKKHSGAYLASRAVNSIAEKYLLDFKETGFNISEDNYESIAIDLKRHFDSGLNQILSKIEKKANNRLNIKSALIKKLPTTFALSYIKSDKSKMEVYNYWAGDSRIYFLDGRTGLHQVTNDDLKNKGDAFDNLINDSPLSNCISAERNYTINSNLISVEKPSIILASTDGAFGYLPTPIHFEYLLVETLLVSNTMDEWKDSIESRLIEFQSDDISIALVVLGIAKFSDLKSLYINRFEFLKNKIVGLDNNDKEILEQETQFAKYSEDNEKYSLSIKSIEEKIQAGSERIQSIERILNSKEYEILDSKNKIERKKKEINELLGLIEQLIKEIELENNEVKKVTESIESQRKELSGLKQANKLFDTNKLVENINTLKRSRENLKRELWREYKGNYEQYLK